jgi:hypothetical protein
MKQLLAEEDLEKIKDNKNTQYIISTMVDDHFKELADEYLNKVIVNGSCVPLKHYDAYK